MITAYIVGVVLGGWLALRFLWDIIETTVKALYYITHRKKIKKEKELSKKEDELRQWRREQWMREIEEKKKKRQEMVEKRKEKDREYAIENGKYGWFKETYGETVDGEKIDHGY